MHRTLRIILAGLLIAACCGPKNGDYQLHILTSNDVHGTYFDSTYVDGSTQNSMLAAYYYVDSVRNAVGKENVVLLDDGDFLQGNNAAYYYNYVETGVPHVFSRMVDYMDYDAVTWGNHDVEPGHDVYDRVSKEIEGFGIPFLGGNAIREDNGEPYFPIYTILKK
ncbi:MAG: bifunctional metallophosphatase/5'-nucleotidase, partial [Bacteroidales bacterium]|nr:bifunctional metallophosphatase/5'-nucleotidase [Bacteroidales bacterium]